MIHSKLSILFLSLVFVSILGCTKDNDSPPTPVYYSPWFTGNGSGNFTIQVSQITQEIVDNGTVMVYNKIPIPGGGGEIPLPITSAVSGSNDVLTISYAYDVGTLEIAGSHSNGLVLNFSQFQFRYVIIPGTNIIH